jgi:hypothetical protein
MVKAKVAKTINEWKFVEKRAFGNICLPFEFYWQKNFSLKFYTTSLSPDSQHM